MLPLLCACLGRKGHGDDLQPSNHKYCPPIEKDAQVDEVFEEFKSDLLCLSGSWFNRVEGLLRAFQQSGLLAELYAVASPNEFVLVVPSAHPATDTRREILLQQLSSLQAPVTQLSAAPRGTASQQVVAAVLPLLQGEVLLGALWLEDLTQQPPHAPRQRKLAAPGSSHGNAAHGKADCEPRQPELENSGAAAAAALLRSGACLQQLSFAVSICLFTGSGSDTLSWLTEAVLRLRKAPSMQALTAQLCTSLAAHVRSRFVLEAAVSAALVPPPTSQTAPAPPTAATAMTTPTMALLFRVPNGDGALMPAGVASTEAVSTSTPTHGSFARPKPLINAQVGAQAGVSPPNSPTAFCSSAASQFNCMTSHGDDTTASLRGFTLASFGAAAAGTAASAGQTSLITSGGYGYGRNLPPGTVIVPLSAAEAAAVTSAAPTVAAVLHADVLPLQHTLLQVVLDELQKQRLEQQGHAGGQQLQQQQQQQHEELSCASAPKGCTRSDSTRSGAGGATMPLPIAVIENTFLYVQNVHNPWRDVWLFMNRQCASTPTGVLSRGSSQPTTTTTVSGSSHRSSMPQSMVLVAASLGEEGAVLGLYLCFSKRLPGPLLEAVRASCQELMDKGLSGLIRGKLEGSLAAEYGMLKAAAPGSYAVVRGLNTCEEGPLGPHSGSGNPRCSGGLLDSLLRRKIPAPLTTSQLSIAMTNATTMKTYALLGDLDDSSYRPTSLTAVMSGVEDLETGFDKSSRGFSNTVSNTSSRRRSLAIRRTSGMSSVRNCAASGPAATAASPEIENNANDFADFLLASCNGDVPKLYGRGCGGATAAAGGGTGATGGGGGGSAPLDGPFASIVTIASVDTQAHQHMDFLLNSVQATMQEDTANNVTNCAFAGDLDQLELVELLGRGGGGVVIKGIMSGSLPVAVKLMVSLEGTEEELNMNPEAIRRGMLRNAMELALQSSLSHPNIVQFYATFKDAVLRARHHDKEGGHVLNANPRSLQLQDAAAAGQRRKLQLGDHSGDAVAEDEVRVTCILAEYCDAGSLSDALVARAFPHPTPNPSQVRTVTGQSPFMYDLKGVYMTLLDVALALRHLHSLHLVHRDVKPANLLLKSNPKDPRGFTVKLADFGFVLQLNEVAEDGSRYAIVDEPCGTITHMAPECWTRRSKICAAADVFSFGILMWELLAGGFRPFPTIKPERIARVIYFGDRPVFSPDVPQTYQSLAALCWQAEPSRRPTARQLVNSITAHLGALF